MQYHDPTLNNKQKKLDTLSYTILDNKKESKCIFLLLIPCALKTNIQWQRLAEQLTDNYIAESTRGQKTSRLSPPLSKTKISSS
jgi:glutamate dehydrogenase/leucine dehydrogenase